MSIDAAAYWDAVADGFDREPDHGLTDPAVRAAWDARLRAWLPRRPADVADLGCGTGSLSLLAAAQGHRVVAVDAAPRMAARARAKLSAAAAPGGARPAPDVAAPAGAAPAPGGAGSAAVVVGDAARPPLRERAFDVVLARHVLWQLPELDAVLARWAALLRPGGRLVLIEGRWGESSGERVGLAAAQLAAAVERHAERVQVEPLADDAALWGREVRDERYAVVARLAPTPRHRESVDVHLILHRPGPPGASSPEVLLARRARTGYADGLFNFPSGHIEDGEDVRKAVLREAREEVGIVLDPEKVSAALVMQHKPPQGRPRMGWFFAAELPPGAEPVNAEPEKCSEIGWFPLDAPPDGMVATCRAGLDAYRAGERFVLHWQEAGDPVAHIPGAAGHAVTLPQAAVP